MLSTRELLLTVIALIVVVIVMIAANRPSIPPIGSTVPAAQVDVEIVDTIPSNVSPREIELSSSSEEEMERRLSIAAGSSLYPDMEYTPREPSRTPLAGVLAYDVDNSGPARGKPMGVPVPAGTLKETSEEYDAPFYRALRPLQSGDYFKPYEVLEGRQRSPSIIVTDTPFYRNRSSPSIGFISSTNAFAPKREINTKWEKIGIVQTVNESDTTIMNLYRRPIAPLQDLYEYAVQDKDGFIVPLVGVAYLEDGDIVNTIPGRESLGKWQVNIYVNNKYVYV